MKIEEESPRSTILTYTLPKTKLIKKGNTPNNDNLNNHKHKKILEEILN
jgi:hypothetical protein